MSHYHVGQNAQGYMPDEPPYTIATAEEAIAATLAGETDEANEHAENLSTWLENGGFPPRARLAGHGCTITAVYPAGILTVAPVAYVTLDVPDPDGVKRAWLAADELEVIP